MFAHSIGEVLVAGSDLGVENLEVVVVTSLGRPAGHGGAGELITTYVCASQEGRIQNPGFGILAPES